MMKRVLLAFFIIAGWVNFSFSQDLRITGLFDGPLPGGLPKVIELYVSDDIPDLSLYGFGVTNNGGGTDGQEWTFPAVSADSGTTILIARDSANFNMFFGFDADFFDNAGSALNFNGDDALELYGNGSVIDVYGDIQIDGSGTVWDYLDGWAYRLDGTGPNGTTFAANQWNYSGTNVMDGETSNATAATPFPVGTYSPIAPPPPATPKANIVITEFMYNSPQLADIEFIELYNNDTMSVNLQGYSFLGITITFPSIVMNPGDYIVITDDSAGFVNSYGFEADLQWESGALSNTGQSIQLIDSVNRVIDSVVYADSAPWPASADGGGPSVVLCDVNSDNSDPANWQRATSSTGYIEDNIEVFANPGAAASCVSGPIVSLAFTTATFPEGCGGAASLSVSLENSNGNPTSVDLNVVGGTASAADYTFTSPTTVTFPASTDSTIEVSFSITDDAVNDPDETIIFELSNATNGAVIATDSNTVVAAQLNKALILVGLYDGPLPGALPRGVELYVLQDIPDLSIYGLGSANNGNGTDGEEWSFPGGSATAGSYIQVARDSANFFQFFGFDADYYDNSGAALNMNGDDALELFESGSVIDVFGDINMDGTGEVWEYLDGWAYRLDDTGPGCSSFNPAEWTYSGINVFDGQTTNAGSPTPFPTATYMRTPPCDTVWVTDFNPTSVTLNWNAVPGATKYEIEGGEVGFAPIMITTGAATFLPASNLKEGGQYYWRVRGTAGPIKGEWSCWDTFTTCSPPTALNVTNLANTTATLNYTPGTHNSTFTIAGRPNPGGPSSIVTINNGTNTSLNATALLPCQEYIWTVYAFCTGGAATDIATPNLFTTTGCPAKTSTDEEMAAELSVDLIPNPATDRVSLLINNPGANADFTFTVYDLSGKRVIELNSELESGFNSIDINTAELAKGVYQVVSVSNDSFNSQKLVIAR